MHEYISQEIFVWFRWCRQDIAQQRKTTCLLSIRKSLACARASKLTTTNMYIARARCESQPTVGSSGRNARWSYGRAIEFKFLAWSSIAQSVCQREFRLLVIRFQRPWVRILRSAEEDNLSPFDSKFACLCQSIKIYNNKHVCMFSDTISDAWRKRAGQLAMLPQSGGSEFDPRWVHDNLSVPLWV